MCKWKVKSKLDTYTLQKSLIDPQYVPCPPLGSKLEIFISIHFILFCKFSSLRMHYLLIRFNFEDEFLQK